MSPMRSSLPGRMASPESRSACGRGDVLGHLRSTAGRWLTVAAVIERDLDLLLLAALVLQWLKRERGPVSLGQRRLQHGPGVQAAHHHDVEFGAVDQDLD